MNKKHRAFAAIVAAILSLATAKVANAAGDCYSTCMGAFGSGFYAPGYFYDDFGNLGGPGNYFFSGCYEDGNTTVCEYSN
jgi:hypothetical protein